MSDVCCFETIYLLKLLDVDFIFYCSVHTSFVALLLPDTAFKTEEAGAVFTIDTIGKIL